MGGLIVAGLLRLLLGRWLRLPFGRLYLYCTLGYGTHGLLDYATSYGTMLFWPFSEERYAASIVSVVDPLLSVPVLVLVLLAGFRNARWPARLALLWLCGYLGLAAVQRQNALAMAEDLAASRGHAAVRHMVKPSFGNILVWRSIYESGGRFHIDGLRAGVGPKVYEGTSVARLEPARDFPWLDPESRQARDLARFDRLSHGYTARLPGAANTVIDVRYATLPTELGALWSIAISPDAAADAHVRFRTDRGNARANFAALWHMIVAELAVSDVD